MNIPLVEDNRSMDVVPRLYRRALLNCLIELKPKFCLEFGTFQLESAEVFSYYFKKYQPEGKLITCDIARWNRKPIEEEVPPYGVYPVMVYPHSLDIEQRHGHIQIYRTNWKEKARNSVRENGNIVSDKMEELGIDEFDFVFVDADHSINDFLSDMYIALPLTKKNGYILIDDIYDGGHQLKDFYATQLKPKNDFYEFEDWQPNPGVGLVCAGDFKL